MAACHAIAPAWDQTDWAAILDAYDELYALEPSPVVALNRAVALCMHEGPAAALAAVAALEEPLSGYHHFYATRADFRRRLGLDAREDYERALALAQNDDERRFLARKLAER